MKKVVVIGGGFAGSYTAKNLEKDFEVTLVDTKDYFEFTPSILRTIVEPKQLRKIQVLHNHYLSKAEIIKEEVKEITVKEVITDNHKIVFDYLVIGAGSSYNIPIKEKNTIIATRATTLRNYAQSLAKARKVLIIGGGLVGIELAAEIVERYHDKEITIIHAHDNLIARNHPQAISYARKFLKKKNVKILYNERMVENKERKCFTDKDKQLEHDILFICTGIKPNSDFIKKNFSNELNSKQKLKINKYLQITNYPNIFSAGDITNLVEEKTAQNAEKQAEIIVRNIKHSETNEELEEYKSIKRPMVISLGKYKGILTYKNFVLTGFIPAIIKKIVEWKTMRRYK